MRGARVKLFLYLREIYASGGREATTSRTTVVVLLCTIFSMTFLQFSDAPVASARHGGMRLDATPENASVLRGEEDRIKAAFGAKPEHPTMIAFEWVSGPNDPDDGPSFKTPDRTCPVSVRMAWCGLNLRSYGVGVDVIHLWVRGHERDEDETLDEADEDTTDVITRTWVHECHFYAPTKEGTNDADVITGTDDKDVIKALGGDDEIFGLDGDDIICGGKGDDDIRGGDGRNIITGDQGSDLIVANPCVGLFDRDSVFGGGGDDRFIVRDPFEDRWCNHFFVPGPGNDVARATPEKEGDIWLSYRLVTRDMKIDLERGFATGEGRDTLIGVEGIDGGHGDDVVIGDGFKNFLEGGPGDDVVRGGDGPDDLSNGGYGYPMGRDRLFGEGGQDYVSGYSKGDVTYGGIGPDRMSGDGVAFGGEGNDSMYAGRGATFYGGPGNDEMTSDRDVVGLFGGPGNDRIEGSNGKGFLSGGDGRDRIIDDAGHDHIEGGEGNDHLSGGKNRDELIGGRGRDTLEGGDDDDHLYGGAHNDKLWGDEGYDFCAGGSGHNETDACERLRERGSIDHDD